MADTVLINKGDLPLEDEGPQKPALIVLAGEEIGRRYLLNEESLVLGRSRSRANIVIRDETVSSRHCRIDTNLETGEAAVTDLDSRNGTLVEDRPVDSAELENGARIRLGATVLKFVLLDLTETRFFTTLEADSLTDLPLKRVFNHQFREAFEKHPDEPLCAMMMDMDGLKAINDEHGHQMGAFCIRSVGKIVSGNVSEANGFACRFGGDEFIAYLRDTEIERAEEVAEAVRAEVEGHEFRREDVVVGPTISIGVASRTPEVNSAEQLLRLADDALYRAKRAGRNRVSR